MFKKIFLNLLIFVAIGELIFRFDNTFQFFADKRIVKIKTGIEDTPEFEMVKNNMVDTSSRSYRVMVLGDSYIYGGGIEFKNNFSQQLKQLLKKANNKFDSIYVLDISKPMANCLDYNNLYFEFESKFKPDVVILGYCYNDVDDNLDKKKADKEKSAIAPKKENKEEKLTIKLAVLRFLTNSILIQRTIHNSIFELKSHGIIVPNSEFDHTLTSYYKNGNNWVTAKSLLQEVFTDCKQKGTQFVFLQFPETDLLNYPDLFTKTDKSIQEFVAQNPNVKYVHGASVLSDEKASAYLLSRYDGHPNALAHGKLAKYVFEMMKQFAK